MSQNILLKFADAGILVNEVAYDKINLLDDPVHISSSLITDLVGKGIKKRDLVILTGEMLDRFLEKEGIISQVKISSSEPNSTNFDSSLKLESRIENLENPEIDTEYSSLGNYSPEIDLVTESVSEADIQSLNIPSNVEFNFEIIQDTSKKSYTSGDIKDMISYFNSRYEKIKGILSKRRELKGSISITDIFQTKDEVKIIGMVKDFRTTKNGHKILEIEDETGEISVLVHNDNHKLFEKSETIVRDEVIGIIGIRKGNLFISSEIIHPGVPRIEEKPMNFSAVFISDVHIGSLNFLEDVFEKFIKWINCEFGSPEQIEIAKDVKYLLVAGDIVDGIGVYPNQDDDLNIKDITRQYEEAARLFGQIRSDIKIIFAPGNHDASRLAEPQPAVPEEYAKALYNLKNAEFVSSPAIVSLDGIKTLIYHGNSFLDITMSIKGLSQERSDIIMKELLEKRHLAPIYGERTPLASEIEDYLVMEDIPHIFHTGHVHINSYKNYKGVHMINSGTFQSQTDFMKRLNIVPTCGEVPVIQRGEFKLLKFSE
ncbi:MAG: DNA-directed DNA polymerase II small subunit [Methanobacteriaceae archaeon]|jgi:DNA polymerase II small subunit|nr:DNA-directed DNA polymerase II small subunit [Methanobacteriaceae archaeon]MDO9628207.1 DNA-directed DNA polymerase II small subunit [Methanobacteriaceae archaeon]